MKQAYLYKRTFEAKEHEKGSRMRVLLNQNPVTSEYMTSYKYILKFGDKGLYYERTFCMKSEAILFAENNGFTVE